MKQSQEAVELAKAFMGKPVKYTWPTPESPMFNIWSKNTLSYSTSFRLEKTLEEKESIAAVMELQGNSFSYNPLKCPF